MAGAVAQSPPQPDPQPNPLREFGRLFTAAVRLGNTATRPAEFREARRRLRAAERLLPRLPEGRRGQAAFYVGVRKTELYARADEANTGRAPGTVPWQLDPTADLRRKVRELALATRDAAMSAPDESGRPVYGGYYRVLLLVLLWQSAMSEPEFLAFLEQQGEVDFIFDPATEVAIEKARTELHAPLHLMRYLLRVRRGESFAARRGLEKLVEEIEHRSETPAAWRGKCLAELAGFFLSRHDYARAEVYLARVDPSVALYPRALIALRRGDYPAAERRGRQLAEQNPVYNLLLGEAIEMQGRIDEALEIYRRGLVAVADIAEDRALALNHIGDCHLLAGRLADAEASYLEALAAMPETRAKYQQGRRAEMLKDLGRLHESKGERVAARDRYRQALAAIEAARRDIPMDLLGSAWLRGNFLVPTIDGLLRTESEPRDAWAAVEKGKARGLLDWMLQPPRDPEGFAALRQQVAALAMTVDPSQLEARLAALERARALSEKAGIRSAQTLTADGIEAVLRAEPGVLFLSYWVGVTDVWLLVGDGGGAAVQVLELGTRQAGIEALGGAFAAVTHPAVEPWSALEAAAEFFVPGELHARLRAAVAVVFCPDSLLSRLPFEALLVGGEPVGLATDVIWAPSLSVHAALRARGAVGSAVVVVDSVAMSDDSNATLSLDPLRHSDAEGDRVSSAYRVDVGTGPTVTRLRHHEATFEALLAALRRAPVDLLHINAHAIASPLVPSQSLLMLASGPESMASLAALPLRGAVVVLSACSSATGEERGGEGVVGLLWGPMAAGARAVVASLWPVNQQSTAALMGSFHRWRAAGLGEAGALRRARAELASTRAFAHPYYWAGFVSYGSRSHNPVWVPVSLVPWGWIGVVALGFGVVVLVLVLRRRAG